MQGVTQKLQHYNLNQLRSRFQKLLTKLSLVGMQLPQLEKYKETRINPTFGLRSKRRISPCIFQVVASLLLALPTPATDSSKHCCLCGVISHPLQFQDSQVRHIRHLQYFFIRGLSEVICEKYR